MKRTRLNRKAKKPKRWKSPDVLERFADAYPEDQLEAHLCGPVWDEVCLNWNGPTSLHIHHVFHVGKRVDVWFNLVRCTARAHYYAHKEPVGGVVACMWVILEIGCGQVYPADVPERRRRIREEWRETFGRDAVGWLEAKRDAGEVPEAYLETCEAVLEQFT